MDFPPQFPTACHIHKAAEAYSYTLWSRFAIVFSTRIAAKARYQSVGFLQCQ